VNLAALRGRTTIVFFGYANCPDVCPATLLNLSRMLDEMPRPGGGPDPVVFVTPGPGAGHAGAAPGWLGTSTPRSWP
jgi:protein SCO1